jgi:hypothetical protein
MLLLLLLLSPQVASPHIKAQWAWASACNLIKMTSVRPEAFPVSCHWLENERCSQSATFIS